MKKLTKSLLFLTAVTAAAVTVPAVMVSCNNDNKKQDQESKNIKALETAYAKAKTFVTKDILNKANNVESLIKGFLQPLEAWKSELAELTSNEKYASQFTDQEKETINSFTQKWLTIPEEITKDTDAYSKSLNRIDDIAEDLEAVLGTHVTDFNAAENSYSKNLDVIKDKIAQKDIKDSETQLSLNAIWDFFLHRVVELGNLTEADELDDIHMGKGAANTHNHSHAATNLYIESWEWIDYFKGAMTNEDKTSKWDTLIADYKAVEDIIAAHSESNDALKEVVSKTKNASQLTKNGLDALLSAKPDANYSPKETARTIILEIKAALEGIRTEVSLTEKQVKFDENEVDKHQHHHGHDSE